MMMRRSSCAGDPIALQREIRITGTGSQTVNLFQLVGAVRVNQALAVIKSITTLTNLTGLYFDLWDGAAAKELTSEGATLSGCLCGAIFIKDQIDTQELSVYDTDQARSSEVIDDKRIGKPFSVMAKHGADTFIRLHYTTTDNPVDFTVWLKIEFEPLNGGYLTPVPSGGEMAMMGMVDRSALEVIE